MMQIALNQMLVAIAALEKSVAALKDGLAMPQAAAPLPATTPAPTPEVSTEPPTYAQVSAAGMVLFKSHGRASLVAVTEGLGFKSLKDVPPTDYERALAAILKASQIELAA